MAVLTHVYSNKAEYIIHWSEASLKKKVIGIFNDSLKRRNFNFPIFIIHKIFFKVVLQSYIPISTQISETIGSCLIRYGQEKFTSM